jgi:hypothetical protein
MTSTMFTAATIPTLLLILLVVAGPRHWRPFLCGGMMSLQDAALVLQPASIGVGWIGLILLPLLVFRPKGSALRETLATPAAAAMLALLAYDLLLIIVTASVFTGHFYAMPSDSAFNLSRVQPIGIVSGHFNQFFYLSIGVGSAIAIGAWLRHATEPERFDRLQAAVLGFVITAGLLCIWQWSARAFGLPYIAQFLHSDGVSFAWDQRMAGFERVSGPFSEPSALAVYMAIATAAVAPGLALGRRRLASAVAVLLGLAALVLSTSTTALAMVPVVLMACAGAAITSQIAAIRARRQAERARWRLAFIMLLVAMIGLALVHIALVVAQSPDYAQLLDQMIFSKERSASYVNREFSNSLGLSIFRETMGLGVGLGGHVASSGVITLGAAFGMFGYLVFGAMLMTGITAPLRPDHAAQDPERDLALRLTVAAAALAALASSLFGAAIITHVWNWLVFGLVIGQRRLVSRDSFVPPPGWVRQRTA